MGNFFNSLRQSLRVKVVALLLAVSLLPLLLFAWIDIERTRAQLLDGMKSLLEARGDQVVHELDAFHRSYQQALQRVARLPATAAFCNASAADAAGRAADTARMLGILEVFPSQDTGIRGAAMIDAAGRVSVATETPLLGVDLSARSNVQDALRGVAGISGVYLSSPATGSVPTISYLAPMRAADGKVACIVALWVRADYFWKTFKASDALAGPGSFGLLMDQYGVRIAHTSREDLVYHPAAPLAPAALAMMVAQRRFGPRTRELLEDVRPFPEQFERAVAAAPDTGVFHGFATARGNWAYGVARRFQTVPWTVFYMVPENGLEARIREATREKALLAAAIAAIAGLVGLAFGASLLRRVRALGLASAAIAGGNLAARVPAGGSGDEIGQLGQDFNAMAQRVQAQAGALQASHDELEERVQQRTVALVETARQLQAEVAERTQAELRQAEQLARLNLLDHITRAIGERQDLQSIYQVVIRSLEEQLPVDFCCICRYDPLDEALTVTGVGVKSQSLAMELAMGEEARIAIDQNGLSRCVQGELVYEPDIANMPSAFAQRLLRGGLRSLVISPLQSESRVFGILVAARLQPRAFSHVECEFVRQLSSHVALAARQAQLHAALQQAYDDLRQTQQAVMQQERLRALGQMASGIAHDINNAISPAALYTESLLEREPGLSDRARSYLENIGRAIDDVAATVARMREFYRQRAPELNLARVDLNRLAQQVTDLTRARWGDMPQRRGSMIELVMELAPDLPAVMGVESEIREALTNLIFNAVDAMPEGGTLTLRTRRLQAPAGELAGNWRHACIEVLDTGTGMDEDTRRRCLEPFFTTKGERGTGLGLAMVYGIAQRHGADIEIDSVPGQGTCVRLNFPLPPQAPAALAQTAPPASVPSRLRILLVDDDPMLLKSVGDTLQADGHVVSTANGGQAGIDAFAAAQAAGPAFDVVVTDLGMPYVDGRKVAASVKTLSPGTPVIMLTGWGQRLIEDGEMPPHVDLVLNKPPRLRELREALAACIRLETGRPAPSGDPHG